MHGEVKISGAKNSVLPLMASAILASGVSTMSNVPDLKDVETMGHLLENMGAEFSASNSSVTVDTTAMNGMTAPYHLVRTMRASVLVLGPLLARMGKAIVSLPGGCAIGARPINIHLESLQKMGADIVLEDGYVKAYASRLHGAHISFDIPTVTGTENLMMAATLADGETVIENAACEPEVVDLADSLQKMGAKIEGAGTSKIRIFGVDDLKPVSHSVIADRIETATFMVAAAITGGNLFIRGARPDDLRSVIEKLCEAGISVSDDSPDGIRVWSDGKLQAVNFKTMPYPGFPTDMQAQLMTLLSVAEGTSIITESIFENRYMHVAELDRLGAEIRVDGAVAMVKGVSRLRGAQVMATDLRASASLVLAGLVAEGKTTVCRIYHLDRGYEAIEKKLLAVGADIVREKD